MRIYPPSNNYKRSVLFYMLDSKKLCNERRKVQLEIPFTILGEAAKEVNKKLVLIEEVILSSNARRRAKIF